MSEPTRCVALDENGRRCRKAAAEIYGYHGDPEIYGHGGERPSYIEAALCKPHSAGMGTVNHRRCIRAAR